MLGEVVGEAARRFGDHPAVIAPDGRPLSYAELDRLSDEVAVGLLRRGLGVGDVLALVMPTMPEYAVAYAAAAKAGIVTAGVNVRLSDAEREAVLAVARPRLVLATPDLAPSSGEVEEVSDRLSSLRAGMAGEVPPPLPDDPGRPVALVFTSGTTGLPKGAVFGGRQLRAVTAADIGDRWGGGGRSIWATSLAHLGFMSKFAGSLRLGGTAHLVTRWRAAEALEMAAQLRMDNVSGIPTQVALMLRVPGFDAYDLSSVRAIVLGGGPASPALVREARARFRAPLAVRYSCTESGIGVGTDLEGPEEDAEVSVGRPRPGVELALLDQDDRSVAPGEVGAVCLRSAAVMSGYHLDAEATRAAFTRDGFVRTGDLGRLDEQGRLCLAGRSKEMYVRGGYNVYPLEVEAVLSDHPGVAAVAVVPRPDPVMGEIGVAVVVPLRQEAAPTLDELREHGGRRLAAYKLPEAIRVTSELPLTAMEKVDRRALVTLVSANPDHSRGSMS